MDLNLLYYYQLARPTSASAAEAYRIARSFQLCMETGQPLSQAKLAGPVGVLP